jgi:phage-related protein
MKFLDALSDEDLASVLAAMAEVRVEGKAAARHLDGPIYEVKADGVNVTYRILFASQGTKGRRLLSLVALNKKTQKTPPEAILLAKQGPRDWEAQGDEKRKQQPKRR